MNIDKLLSNIVLKFKDGGKLDLGDYLKYLSDKEQTINISDLSVEDILTGVCLPSKFKHQPVAYLLYDYFENENDIFNYINPARGSGIQHDNPKIFTKDELINYINWVDNSFNKISKISSNDEDYNLDINIYYLYNSNKISNDYLITDIRISINSYSDRSPYYVDINYSNDPIYYSNQLALNDYGDGRISENYFKFYNKMRNKHLYMYNINTGIKPIPKEWLDKYHPGIDDSIKITITHGSGNLVFGIYDNHYINNVEYSYDNINWINIKCKKENWYYTNIPMDEVNHPVCYFRGRAVSYNNSTEFRFNGYNGDETLSVEGNIMAMLGTSDFYQDSGYNFAGLFNGFNNLTDASKLILPATVTEYCYQSLFQNCYSLISVPELPATTLADSCYDSMFSGCTSLTTTPELPATILTDSCYSNMFSGCTSLTIAPELPATILAYCCYYSMFSGCTNLVTTPELSAITLAGGCYSNMFNNCTSLTTTPELPATILTYDCYSGMFSGCTNLTTTSELPATTLADNCYRYMFNSCTNLTTAPELPATTLVYGCYYGMFYYCTNLTTAPELPATTLADSCYDSMFSRCTSLTTTPELPATTLVRDCYEYMFSGCTSLTTAPELPATTLAYYCYFNMFSGCTSLTTAPSILPATTLAYDCYYSMFSRCTSLTTAPELPATTLAQYCYYEMFYGCTSLTTAPKLPAATLEYCCYYRMFYGCTNLNYVICLTTGGLSYWTHDWLSGVSPTGTFVKLASNTNIYPDQYYIPSGWTIVDYEEAA